MPEPLVLEGTLTVYTDYYQFAKVGEEDDIPCAIAGWLGEDNHEAEGRYRVTVERLPDA